MAAKNKFLNAMKMPSIDDMFSSEADRQRESGDLVTEVPLSELHPFVGQPRLCALAIEHIIRANVCHLTVQLFTSACNILSTTSIDSADFFHFVIVFCHIYSSPCRAVDHSIRIYCCDYLFDSIFIGDV